MQVCCMCWQVPCTLMLRQSHMGYCPQGNMQDTVYPILPLYLTQGCTVQRRQLLPDVATLHCVNGTVQPKTVSVVEPWQPAGRSGSCGSASGVQSAAESLVPVSGSACSNYQLSAPQHALADRPKHPHRAPQSLPSPALQHADPAACLRCRRRAPAPRDSRQPAFAPRGARPTPAGYSSARPLPDRARLYVRKMGASSTGSGSRPASSQTP